MPVSFHFVVDRKHGENDEDEEEDDNDYCHDCGSACVLLEATAKKERQGG